MPNNKIQSLTVQGVTYDIVDNTSGYITGITSGDVTTALGFTPYNATNPNGYTSNTGTITSVKTTAGAHTTINVSSGAANFNVPTKTSHLTNDSGFLTSFTETDPTVPAWAKAETKPSYTFSEIGSTPTTLSGYGITNAYTKTEVDGLVAGVLHYKGTKATTSALPSTGNVTGDVWHVTADGSEWAWDGTDWQELGTAIDLSTYAQTSDLPTSATNSTTGISISAHSTTTIYGVTSETTSVRGVKTGTNSTTTASKASGGNGSASNWVFENVTVPIRNATATSIPNVTSAGSASTWAFGDVTVPIRADADTTVPTAASSATTVPIKNTNSTTVPTAASSATTVPIKDASATDCDDITNWVAGSGSLTFTMDSTDTKKLVITHTHTAPTLSYTAKSICGVQSTTTSVTGVSGSTSIYGVQSTTTSVTGVSGSTTVRGVKTGTSSTTTASHVTSGGNGTAPTLGTAISIYGVDGTDTTTASHVKSGGNGTAPTWSFTDVTVPIRADADTVVPIKNSTTTTVATSGTHSITDNGHTHSLS